ncbi:hypothetical protein [Burkholderia vietnamiensis]|uniref:hypothetical protein n=2 Tax=Burkholderia cepacia complex TaxID=87882 RepID=UPI0015944FBA|nr:hypothetical protein [Burkholderia vietnamiensis]
MRVLGMEVIESPLCAEVPRMTVSPRFAELMPAEFVSDLNRWMREFFGTSDVSYIVEGRTIVMSPRAAADLRRQASQASVRPGHWQGWRA